MSWWNASGLDSSPSRRINSALLSICNCLISLATRFVKDRISDTEDSSDPMPPPSEEVRLRMLLAVE